MVQLREDMESRYVTVEGPDGPFRWRVHSWAGAGEPVLFLHGFTGTGLDVEGIATGLGEGQAVIAPDLPGHGRTEFLSNRGGAWVECLYSLLKAMNLSRVHLCGYSMGGRLAMRLARAIPACISTLTLLSCFPGIRDEAARVERRRWDLAVGENALRMGAITFAKHWEGLPLLKIYRPGLLSRRVSERREKQNPAGLNHALEEFGSGVVPPCWERLHELEMPTVLLAGQFDSRYCDFMQEMAVEVGEFHVLEGAGHCLHLDSAMDVARLIPNQEDRET